MGQIRRPDNFGDGGKPQPQGLSREPEHQQIFETAAVSAAARAPLSVERSEFFRVCSRLLAIATLNGFGERCNLFDSRCEILCTSRLLLGSSCRLG